MEFIATIIDSLANLLWPLIVIAILFIFRKSVEDLIESASGRKFNVRIGEMELSMDELSQQQAIMIEDLQTRVNELQKKMEGKADQLAALAPPLDSVPQAEATQREVAKIAKSPHIDELDIDDDITTILWVDDQPKNNALLIDALRKQKITVIPAESTAEALARFKDMPFNCVISDSCRREGNKLENCQAGIELARKLREVNKDVPIYIYTDKTNPKLKQKAEDAGATAVTSSPSELLKLLSD